MTIKKKIKKKKVEKKNDTIIVQISQSVYEDIKSKVEDLSPDDFQIFLEYNKSQDRVIRAEIVGSIEEPVTGSINF